MEKEIENLIIVYENEALMAKQSIKSWKGRSTLLMNLAESKQTTYERVIEDLKNLIQGCKEGRACEQRRSASD